MVDLGGYIIILMNHNGKIKLYGSPADNADSLEVGDEILEVNGRTLENATHSEVIQHIHQCIKSRTICLRVRRRSGNKMEELDGPNAGRIRDAWVIAVERGARERLQRLTALRRIQPRDIQAILHQQISEGAASTSGSGTDADVTSSQITVTLADKDLGTNAYPTKLSNGTIPKGIPKAKGDTDISAAKERKDILEKQQSCPEEANLLTPLQSAKVGERRASSPFQNGRTEVLIGEPEGGPRSPRGSTSSAANESNFLSLSEERDYPEPICRSRRRSASGVPDIHLQQGQLQENNNSSRETKESKEGLGPDEMWAPGALGHHRELPVDVPDTLLQQAYPNKVKNYSPGYRSDRRSRSASDLDLSLNLKNKRSSGENAKVGGESATLVRVEDPAKIDLKIENSHFAKDKKETEAEVETDKGKHKETEDTVDRVEKVEKVEKVDVAKVTKLPNLKDIAKRAAVDEEIAGQKESSVDAEEDYPFAKEDYPTMLKTCSDDSASPRSSSGRSDSTAPLDTSLILRHRSTGKNSPLYDARRIDLGSPCRSIVPEIKIAPLFSRARDSTSFDNPAYGLADLQDLQGLLMRSDEVSDLTCLIDEQGLISGKSREQSQMSSTWSKDHVLVEGIKTTKKGSKRPDEQSRTRGRRDLDVTKLIKCSTEDLIQVELTNISSKNRVKKKKQSSSGYSTLKSEASTDLDQDSAFLVDANRVYREVAVDCPADFVPVTKCHPVYPPPNKTPGHSKHNTLESSTARSKSIPAKFNPKDVNSNGEDRGTLASSHNEIKNIEPTNNNRSSLLLADNARETVVARTVDQRGEKVRSKVKSLLFDSFPFKHSKKPAAYSTTPCSSSNNHSSNDDLTRTRDSLSEPTTLKITNMTSSSSASSSSKNSNLYELAPTQVESVATASRCCSRQNLLETSIEPEQPLFYDNPCLDVSKDEGSAPGSPARIKFSSFLGDVGCSCNGTGDTGDSKTPSKSIASHPEFPLELSFTQETNQNSRNSFRELISRKGIPLIVYYSPKEERAQLPLPRPDELDPDRLSSVKIRGSQEDFCPTKQNQKNSRLSLEYKGFEYSKLSDHSPRSERLSRENLKANEALSKSDLDLSSALDVSIFKVHSWLSYPHLTSRSLASREPASSPKPDTTCTPNHSNKHATAISPPQRPPSDTPENSMYDSVHPYEDIDDIDNQQTGLNGVKPAIPPRDQKRAPARPPKDNLRLSTQNNNVEPSDNANTEPTQQQLHSIRKYQEQLRKRKDEEEKQEVLNRSLRGSRKLQALESHATSLSGQENPAYAQDELSTVTRSHISTSHATQEVEEPPRPLTYGEVVATLERLQIQLRNISGALGISGPGVEAELEAVRTLLVQRRFATALATHHALKTRLRSVKLAKHHAEDASNLARDCIEVLEQWQSSSTSNAAGDTIAAVEELTGLLTSYEMEGLLLAHDSIVSYVEGFQRKQGSLSSSPSGPPSPSSSTRGSRIADNIKIIRIEKTNEPLGATVRNEGDAVIIGRVVRGGAADKSGLLHEGDEVLEVNGVEMRGKSVNEVCDILAGMQGSLTFLVLPAPTNHRNNLSSNKREDNTQIQHVRAHFDYDPEEDPYIPCRELGVSFQKGDVLHVISQEDPNWWQAYREGEEDQTLAGLIPSRAFQHQRESMKQTIAGDKSTVRGAKKSSTLLCARKNPKKKKRSKFGSNFNDDGYPLYATTAIDDYDSEEVLTYEEVALYYPRANHKRPIVLIGPPNIGRHELRQRLMQDSERFAAAIPHTSRPRKDSEVDGQDYHFISRSQFESDILCRKFVEHGEYEKAYYGTSVEAIRSVVNSAKICVLNLHPQSLKILRSSDLKPYVVFVAPPSLEKLRQKRLKNNESFKEEELKDIIEKAREMEDKYGHLFDMIIINNDTDRAYNQLLTEINSLEREPQWVPATWVP